GGSATFRVSATGGGLNYQWLFNGQAASYPNSPTITVSNVNLTLAGLWSVEVFNNAGRITSGAARLGVCSPGINHTYRDRPWVRILATGDPVPGSPNTFGTLMAPFSPLFTLRDQTLNLIARGDNDLPPQSAIHRGLVQWRDGVLTTLVFTNTPNPRGGTFEDVFYPTEDGDGAINFASGSMFEIRGGTIRELVGPDTTAPGRTEKIFGPGSFARRGSRVVIATTIGTPGSGTFSGTGLYLHDGSQLIRLCDDTSDLPGSMAGYAGRATEDSVNIDENTVVFSTITGINGLGGVYKSTFDGVITKLADNGDGYQGFGDVDVEGGTIFAIVGAKAGTQFVNRVLAFEPGATVPSTIGTGNYLVAAGPNEVYFGVDGGIQRWSSGVLEPVITTTALLDCKRIRRFVDVEAQGDDVAIAVEFMDGTAGVYANFGRPTIGQPKILGQPLDVRVPETVPAVFAVSASGPSPIAYQWRKNGVPISGATGATLTLIGTGAADTAEYDVVVTAGGASVTSRKARLQLDPAPVFPAIFGQPQSTIVDAGRGARLEVIASGAGPLTYQWRLGTNAISGANQRALELTPTTNVSFNVVVANGSGAVTSSVASIQVRPLLVRLPQPARVAVGGEATFSVEASGFESYRYFWFKDGVVVAGATNAVLKVSNVQTTDAGVYAALVLGNGGSSVRSPDVTLTVGEGGGGGAEIRLGSPAFVAGQVAFSLPTAAGKTYEVQFQSALGAGAWSTLRTVAGDGTEQTVRVAPDGVAGFVRVAEKP
ncbi:MAG: immunoglobulin domain-containing protein, partial [Verrucomicrobiales bacterium]|nr:immunoglobulin domain-containing protein [Verrucomicrobiales bacterium]